MAEMNRRAFLASVSAATASLYVLNNGDGAAAAALAQVPATGPAAAPAAGAIDIGPKAGYAKEGVTDTWMAGHKFAVVRHGDKIYAQSSICTHRGCKLRPEGDHLFCKCHHSVFSPEGTVTAGPAKRSLARFAIAEGANGHLTVDPGKSFEERQWDDPASFVAADAK